MAHGRRLDLSRHLRHQGDFALLSTRLTSHGDELEELELGQNELLRSSSSRRFNTWQPFAGRIRLRRLRARAQ